MEGRFCRLEPLQVDSHIDDLYQANAFDKDGRSWTYLAYGPFFDKDSYREPRFHTVHLRRQDAV